MCMIPDLPRRSEPMQTHFPILTDINSPTTAGTPQSPPCLVTHGNQPLANMGTESCASDRAVYAVIQHRLWPKKRKMPPSVFHEHFRLVTNVETNACMEMWRGRVMEQVGKLNSQPHSRGEQRRLVVGERCIICSRSSTQYGCSCLPQPTVLFIIHHLLC